MAVVLATLVGSGSSQRTPAEKRVPDIENEQPWNVVAASPLCQAVRANPSGAMNHRYEVPPSAFMPDLTSLMEKRDAVVLASYRSNSFNAIAPSGQDAIQYIEVRVLQTWKGPYKPGDIVTFTIPNGVIECSLSGVGHGPHFSTTTGSWLGLKGTGPMVLFLRHSQGSETRLTPDLRLTGGGVQGMFELNFSGQRQPQESGCGNNNGTERFPENPEMCLEFLRGSDSPVMLPYIADRPFRRFDGMATSEFLSQVQDVADSLGYVPAGGNPR